MSTGEQDQPHPVVVQYVEALRAMEAAVQEGLERGDARAVDVADAARCAWIVLSYDRVAAEWIWAPNIIAGFGPDTPTVNRERLRSNAEPGSMIPTLPDRVRRCVEEWRASR